MKKTTTPASKLGDKLANNKMVQVVARLFGKEDFSVSEEGSLELSEEEESKIAATYGDGFLSKLKALNFSDASSQEASDLFDEAVRVKAAELTADKDATIKHLQGEVERLCALGIVFDYLYIDLLLGEGAREIHARTVAAHYHKVAQPALFKAEVAYQRR